MAPSAECLRGEGSDWIVSNLALFVFATYSAVLNLVVAVLRDSIGHILAVLCDSTVLRDSIGHIIAVLCDRLLSLYL